MRVALAAETLREATAGPEPVRPLPAGHIEVVCRMARGLTDHRTTHRK